MSSQKAFFTILAATFSFFVCQATTPEEHGLTAMSSPFYLEPSVLLTPSRFDIAAKYIYAKLKEKNVSSTWGHEVYKNHIKAINNFYESSPYKRGIDAFTSSFHETLMSIKEKGYTRDHLVLPVDANLNPRDGSHRAAACILYSVWPICRIYNYAPPVSYIFSDYLVKQELEEKYADAMAMQYCILKKNTYMVTVTPAAVGKDAEIKNILNQFGIIVYRKNVLLTWNGTINFTRLAYKGESWLGTFASNFAGAQNKASFCFGQDHRKNNPMRVFLFECDSLEKVKLCKQAIRSLFHIQNHSVHINDTHEQSIEMTQALFVKNSIHFLNHAKPKSFKNFLSCLEQYKCWIKTNNIDAEDLCIESGAVLAAYGIRDSGDIDFLHHNLNHTLPKNGKIEDHNKHHNATERDDIIYNPEKHFWFQGVKFASLKEVKKQKTKGGGPPNKDVLAINTLLNH